MQLVERRQLSPQDAACRWLPGLPTEVTIAQLLTHSAGLAPYADYLGAWGDTVAPSDRGELVVNDIAHMALKNRPGCQFEYSCLGYVCLRAIFEHISGITLEQWFATEIAGPLGLADTGFLPSAEAVARCAPTAGPGSDRAPGLVHDSIAYYVGGVGGNAGLFGTARDLSRFMAMVLNGGSLGEARILRPDTVQLMTTPQLRLQEADRGFGWDVRSPYSAVVRGSFPAGSFGHTGFTGTSIWADPASGVHVIILTNRVHLGENRDIGPLRYRIASVVAASLIGSN
jgi:CubicO group peptidase (beta-lactamase class C family)